MKDAVVYIVDDDEAVREALRMLFVSVGYGVSAHADADEMLSAYDPALPACLLLDLRMPGRSGLQLQDLLMEHGFTPPIIFLTGHGDVGAAVQALKHGALDFIQKPVTDTDALLERVDEAIRRHRDSLEAARGIERVRRRLAQLTPREAQVMREIAAGKLNKVVAAELGISERTVEHHRARVMRKLGVRSVADLVRMCEDVRD